MERSQALTNAGSAGAPKCGVAAASRNARVLNINVLHRVIGADLPGLNGVVLIDLCGRERLLPGRACRLDIALIVGRTALQQYRLAIPIPWQAEARQAFGQDRTGQLRLYPCGAA